MDKSIYITANGADQLMHAMQANNHNLANASTIGFKADVEVFKTLLPESHEESSLHTRAYSHHSGSSADFTQGALIPTGRDLDVAITTTGFFAVDTAEGQEAYTRRGDFVVSPEGLLTTASGLPVLGNGGPISIPPSNKVEIANDGTISAQLLGQAPGSAVVLDRLKLVNPNVQELKKGVDGLFYHQGEEQPVADSKVNVVSGTVEGSNVSPVTALVTMMDLTRQFEVQMKLVKALEQSDSNSAQIMQID